MDRITLTPEDETAISTWKTEHDHELSHPVSEGTNLVELDHIEFDGQYKIVVLGGQDGAIQSYIPEWGGMIINIDLVDYITDRAGPNGETMPIYDPQQQQARSLKAAAENPKQAAKVERAHRRDVKEVLRAALKRLDPKERKHARDALRSKGVLGKDEKDDDA